MRLKKRWSVVLLTIAVVGCDSGPTELIIRGGLECNYEGPSEIEPGWHDVILFPEGLENFEVEVFALDQGTSLDDVIAHYESDNARFDPPATQRMLSMRYGGAVRGLERSVQLVPGRYAIVCFRVDPAGRRLSKASTYPLTVSS